MNRQTVHEKEYRGDKILAVGSQSFLTGRCGGRSGGKNYGDSQEGCLSKERFGKTEGVVTASGSKGLNTTGRSVKRMPRKKTLRVAVNCQGSAGKKLKGGR